MKKKRGAYQGSYGKFLETLDSPDDSDDESEIPKVLVVLHQAGGDLGLKALLDKTTMRPLRLVRVIEEMKAQSLVTVKTVGGDDVVELTATGEKVAELESGGGL